MSLSIGIVGLPNVGKSTLFQAITKKRVDIANYPFCTIDPNVGVVAVPDKRLDKLAELLGVERKINTTVEFFDIAGLIKGANKGEGLGNQFLANIRETDAIVYVLRAFSDSGVVNTQEKIDPIKEKEILDTELVLKDLETINKRLESLEKDIKVGKKEFLQEKEVLGKTKLLLEQGKILFEQDFTEKERKIISQYQLLTMKPRIYLLNGKEVDKDTIDNDELSFLVIDIISELNASDLSKEERETLGLPPESELGVLIKKAYEILDLVTFFTQNANEVRAWTVKKGSRVPMAGGVVHSDFEDKFIKALVINWKDLLDAGGFAKAREKGLIRTEGKDYVVQDGDIIEIKHG